MVSIRINKLVSTVFSLILVHLKYVVAVLLLSVCLQSFSETIIVGGELEESQTWTSDNIYIVNQDLIVPSGITLTIQAGVLVKINFGRGIFIENGSLEVFGTQIDSVSFVPNYINVGEEWNWKGLAIKNNNAENITSINYTRFIDAAIAIKLEDCHNVNIENSYMYDSQNLGVLIVNSSSCLVNKCKIENNYNGIEILATNQGESSNNIISNCHIENRNFNVTLQGESEGIIDNNLITGNLIEQGSTGIWISTQENSGSAINIIERNLILNNGSQSGYGYGVFLALSSTVVSNNIFWRNNTAIYSESNGDNCTINNNSFYQNTNAIFIGSMSEANKYLNNTFSLNNKQDLTIREANNVVFRNNNLLHNKGLDIIVKNENSVDLPIANNYWGTTDTTIINNLIYDYWDNTSLGELNYNPYLDIIDTANPVSPPFKVIKQIDGNKVRITWNANQEADLMGYKIYYGTYSNYEFLDSFELGKDTSFLFSTSQSVFDLFAVTAFDSTLVSVQSQLTGHESPYGFAVLYPFAGRDTAYCRGIDIIEVEGSNIPLEYQSVHWTSSGDGFFITPNILAPKYLPGMNDYSNGGATLTMNVITIDDEYTDSFNFTIVDNPVIFAGNDTIIFPDMNLSLIEATVQNVDSVKWLSSGDGTFDNDTYINPVYSPGTLDIENGIVILEMKAYSYCGLTFDTLLLIIDSYYSVEGKLWAHNKSTSQGVVIAFIKNDEVARAVQIESVDSDGSFRFEKLIEADYYLYGLPDSNNIDNLVPCYYANKTRWQSAYILNVNANVFDADIYLPAVDYILPIGEASISGHFVMPQNSQFISDIYCMPWFENSTNIFCDEGLSNVTVFLYNHDKSKILDYTLTDYLGNFYFNDLPFGTYIVDAEKAGFESVASSLIILTPDNNNEPDVILEITQEKISITLNNTETLKNTLLVFPNPSTTEINISFFNPLFLKSKLEVFDLFGNSVLSLDISTKEVSYTNLKIDIKELSSGLYFGQISNSNQTQQFRFVKR